MTNQAQPRHGCQSPSVEPAFTLLCTGGRDYQDRDAVFRALDATAAKHPNITILHGACLTGADQLAQEWAVVRQRPYIGVPARWDALGDRAGPVRNGLMLCYLPDGIAAFPGGSGTADCIAQAEAAGLKVWRVRS